MSQSGRFVNNQPVPGAGIEFITGNNLVPVPGDGGANINLVGAGTITVTGVPGANSLTISSTGLPATYTTDNAVAVPDAFGNVNVVGGTNINTDALVANTITINLDDNVSLAGSLTANGFVHATTGNIVAAAGDIIATAGNVEAGAQVIGNGGGVFHDTVTVTANGINATGLITFLSVAGNGVVQTDPGHNLFADGGTANGQILISDIAGAPQWRNIQPGRGIAVINTPNGIQLQGTPALPTVFNEDVGGAVAAAGILRINGDANITTRGAGNQVTVNLNDNVDILGAFTAGTSITANNDIASNNGNLVAINGSLSAVNGTMHSLNAIIDGNTTLTGQLNGVLRTNGAGLVTASNGAPYGTNGMIIISGPAQPLWGRLESVGGTVVITNPGNNRINLEAPAAAPLLAFRSSLYRGVNFYFSVATPTYDFGTAQVMVNDFDTNGAFYPGDGINNPAAFVVPFDGIYRLCMNVCISTAVNFEIRDIIYRMINITHPFTYYSQQILFAPVNAANTSIQQWLSNGQYCELIQLVAGDSINFQVEARYDTITGTDWMIGPNALHQGQCNITGFLVRRL